MADITSRFDAIVVGSGAAGSIAVKELTERGLDVLLLEAGRDLTEDDFKPLPPPKKARPLGLSLVPRARAALRGQHVQARRTFFMESSSRFLVNDRENPYTTPRGEPFVWIRGKILGGRLNSYGKVLLRMSDHDFKAASRDGMGEDWPFSYSDLAPYYDRVEEFIGVYGNADGVEAIPDGKYVGPAKLSGAEQDFKAKVEARWPERRVISWRYQAPNLERVPRGIAAARETGRLTTRTDAIVRQITVDEKTGRADGAIFVDRDTKTEQRVSADIVVLCASTIESIRLMLNSACASHPNGLGNSSGLLGRYFMDQTISMAFGGVPHRVGSWDDDDSAPRDPFYGASGGLFIPRFQNLDGGSDSGFLRGFAFQGAGGRFPVPPDHPTSFGIGGIGEMLPNYHNRVTLNRGRTDAWGIPIPHIRCAIGDNERALIREQTRVLEEMGEAAGLRLNFVASMLGIATKKVFPDADPFTRFAFRRGYRVSLSMGGAIHECGGVRMGSDPAKSVLNEHNQCWDVPNLFVTDGSCFASGGTVGPTLTIMAVTARACDYIAREHAGPGGLTTAAAAR
jgi:choline dehydrogenase-like flavoprotein